MLWPTPFNGGHGLELTEQIRSFVNQNLAVYDDDLQWGNDDNIFELGYVDSVFAIQLVCYLEQTFGLQVQDEDLDVDNFSSVNRIVAFLQTKGKTV
jgi:acyl carrier protein